ncbi:hypothetical protein K3757_03395 [Sulfitobacter sp. S223]|uniref:hypothetical protein n=1 Tax=Sulfitobacter sp. S223 TaxID=2867023 RepID=UPI0021A7AA39|nr:hypothetical protein [Sulfitobacter sp. S223]UWR26995.1 hypothetical protein K3757_03395 [Sulfitobacter sp. S223]
MKRLGHILSVNGLLALMVLALLSVPFVHRAGAAPVTPEMSRFVAMGGNLSDICGENGGHRAGGCESCMIVGSMMLTSPVLPQHPVFASSYLDTDQARAVALLPAAPRTNPPVRAPPQK